MSGERPGDGSKASEDGKGKGKEASAPSIKKEAKVQDSTGTEKMAGAPKKEEDPVKELVQEAAGLLRSLRGSALKKVQVSSLEVRNQRALLDGGATHCLRQAKSEAEWLNAKEVTVQLAQGSTVLH